jgi:hypothetical protein
MHIYTSGHVLCALVALCAQWLMVSMGVDLQPGCLADQTTLEQFSNRCARSLHHLASGPSSLRSAPSSTFPQHSQSKSRWGTHARTESHTHTQPRTHSTHKARASGAHTHTQSRTHTVTHTALTEYEQVGHTYAQSHTHSTHRVRAGGAHTHTLTHTHSTYKASAGGAHTHTVTHTQSHTQHSQS